jgi:transcriptional regulator with XRE-family HTH domain
MAGEHRFGAIDGVSSVNNIERFREAKGWSRPKLGERMGTSGQQVERLEKGLRKLSQDWIDKAATALGVSPADIITPLDGVPHMAPRSDHLPTRTADAGDTVEVIALDLSLSMGPGTLIEEFVEEEPVRFDIALLRAITRAPFSSLRVVKGIGDSMEPTLRTNDRLLIDTSEKMLSRTHGVYWMDHLGAHGVKRLRPMGQGRVLIMSDNPAVPDYDVDADEMRIHGRAIWLMRDL